MQTNKNLSIALKDGKKYDGPAPVYEGDVEIPFGSHVHLFLWNESFLWFEEVI